MAKEHQEDEAQINAQYCRRNRQQADSFSYDRASRQKRPL